MSDKKSPLEVEAQEVSKYRTLSGFWKLIVCILTIIGILLSINQLFNLGIGGTMIEKRYLYILIMIFVSIVFLLFPISQKAPRMKVPWYDACIFVVSFVTAAFLAVNSMKMVAQAWEFTAPPLAVIASFLMWAAVAEAVRRTSGLVMSIVALIFSFYPLVAPNLPGIISGMGFDFVSVVKYLIIGSEGITGTPAKVFGNEIIGFLIFGVVLQASGGGRFFMNLAFSLMGHMRGGPAKVAVLSSALMGSISGSVISNVITTGSITIPTMKANGYRPEVAGAVESCSSTGGVLMPPVMGAVAFIMASFLSVPYSAVVIAAIIPALLYYLSLIIQVDFYAAKNDLVGLPKDQLPDLKQTLKEGWWYIFALVLLIYLMIFVGIEVWAPYYVSALLLFMAMISKATRLNKQGWINLVIDNAKILAELMTVLTSIGFIIGSLSMTGMAQAFSAELIFLAGDNSVLLLIMGALACFILGFGMTVSAAYIFIAIVLVPALTTIGFEPMAVHMFVLYWGMLSYITPPVALACFTAASIAGSNPIKTGITSMRMGCIIYFLPFFFVYNPALLLMSDSVLETIWVIFTSVIGIFFIGGALQGYMLFIGKLGRSLKDIFLKIIFIAMGFLMMIPEKTTDIIGLVLLAMVVTYVLILNKKTGRRITT
jgi:TRAP transporter 4TM/12TM fusion protein